MQLRREGEMGRDGARERWSDMGKSGNIISISIN
jgi:hypothetical protein